MTASTTIDATCLTDPGRVREINEDRGLVVVPENVVTLNRKGILMVIADGMGGHDGGELASSITVDCVNAAYYDSSAGPDRALPGAVRAANQEVLRHARRDPQLAGMGTTCTAIAVVNGYTWLAHVGDSRLYLVRGGATYRMTQDHSATMELVARGLITLSEAEHHEDRNVILRAVGTRDQIDIDTWTNPFPLRTGDRLVLATDGLYQTIPDEEIGRICSAHETSLEICHTLLALALERDGNDNITVAVLCVAQGAR